MMSHKIRSMLEHNKIKGIYSMDWIITILSFWSKWLAGKKNKHCWTLQIVSQIPWVYIMFKNNLWGFLPMTIMTLVMSIYNYYLWSNPCVNRIRAPLKSKFKFKHNIHFAVLKYEAANHDSIYDLEKTILLVLTGIAH